MMPPFLTTNPWHLSRKQLIKKISFVRFSYSTLANSARAALRPSPKRQSSSSAATPLSTAAPRWGAARTPATTTAPAQLRGVGAAISAEIPSRRGPVPLERFESYPSLCQSIHTNKSFFVFQTIQSPSLAVLPNDFFPLGVLDIGDG